MKSQKRGQILVITLLVLTILSILTVSLVLLNSRDVSQTVNSEAYEKIYNTSETKLQEIIQVVADPSKNLTALTAQYGAACINLGGAISTYECDYQLPSDSDPTIMYTDKVTISNEKDILNYSLDKDRPLSISLVGYSSKLNISISKAAALDFTLIYLQGGVYKTLEGVYDPSTGTYSSTDPVFKTYFTPDTLNPQSFVLAIPSTYSAFQLLNITPRLTTASDSILINVTATDVSTYPVQIRKFVTQAYDTNNTDSPLVRIETQIPLNAQLDGLLDYSLLTPDKVSVGK